MLIIEDACMAESPEDLIFYENALILDTLYHNSMNIIGMSSTFMEEGGSRDGIIGKMIDGIIAILDKIDSLIKGTLDGIRATSKKRLTAHKYMQSATAECVINLEILEMQKRVNEEYLKARPVIQKISSATGFDAEEVEAVCDGINKKLSDNKDKISAGAKGIVKGAALLKIRDVAAKQLEESTGWKKKTEESVNRLRRSGDKKKVSALSKFANTLGNLTNNSIYIINSVNSELRKSEKKKRK